MHFGCHRQLLIYNTILSLMFLLPFLFLSEAQEIVNHPSIYDPNVWYLNFLAGLLGYAINIVVFLQIKLTSPLTNNIAGQVKAAIQTILAVYFFGNPVSTMVCSSSNNQLTPRCCASTYRVLVSRMRLASF
jgi:solute carrier family 35 (GDP-fucose transporter), member C1